VNKNLIFLIIFLFVCACSVDNKINIWSAKKNKNEINNDEILFKDSEQFASEFNTNIKLTLKDSYFKESFINNYKNNNKIVNYSGNFENRNKFSYTKIDNFYKVHSDLIITKKNEIIYFDGRGNIIKLDKNLKLVWTKNFYNKKEKKTNLSLSFAANENILIVVDNLSYYYAINILSGDIIWKKKNNAAFNSQVKVLNNKFYTLDFDNVLWCYSAIDGSKIWNYKSDNTFIKSVKKMSLVIDDNKLIFINSVGDLNALDLENGNLLWQVPTQSSSIIENSFSVIYSDLIMDDNALYLSNNQGSFLAINSDTGAIRWSQNINSTTRSTIVKNLIFVVSSSGYLIIINKLNGEILRSTNLKKNIKKYGEKVENIGFIVAKDKIFLSLNNGYVLKVNISDGVSQSIYNIGRENISRPYVNQKKLIIATDKYVISYN